jgi:hypothetical protein
MDLPHREHRPCFVVVAPDEPEDYGGRTDPAPRLSKGRTMTIARSAAALAAACLAVLAAECASYGPAPGDGHHPLTGHQHDRVTIGRSHHPGHDRAGHDGTARPRDNAALSHQSHAWFNPPWNPASSRLTPAGRPGELRTRTVGPEEHDLPDSSQYGDSSHPQCRMRAVQ